MYENPEALFRGKKLFLEHLSLIYSAVEQPSLWPVVLDGIAEIADSGCTCLIAGEPHGAAGGLLGLARTDPSYLAAYARHYA